MKIKNFIILLLIGIVLPPVIIFGYKGYKENSKNKIIDQYETYGLKMDVNQPNFIKDYYNIIFNDSKDMELKVTFKNNNNKASNLKLLVFIDNRLINFYYNNRLVSNFEFNTGGIEEKYFSISVPKDLIKDSNHKITVTLLKQEDICRYNDGASLTYNILNKKQGNIDMTNMKTEKLVTSQNKFSGVIINTDYNLANDYNGYNYNKKIFKEKVTEKKMKIVIRIPELKADNEYMIYFTLGDKIVRINNSENYLFTIDTDGSVTITADLEINLDKKEDYLFCHLITEPYNFERHDSNIISNKILLYK